MTSDTLASAVEAQVERISDADKAVLDATKVKRELALERAKAALAQNEAAELAQNNVMLQLAMKYSLKDQDAIKEDGEIVRKQ